MEQSMVSFKFECVDLDVQNQTEHYGRFVFNSLDVGTGQTIGTLLRRVLLTNLPGLRIVAVKISGVTNEFSTIQGVREDSLEILLNLKELIFKGKKTDPNFGVLKIKGPAIVTANCIKLTPEIEVVNPDHYIATITDQITLEIRMVLNWGKGYTLAENRPIEKSSLDPKDYMEIDAVFMPVTNVVFNIETSFSESLGTQERLILDLWTDGSLTPSEAMAIASETILSWFKKVESSNLALTKNQETYFFEKENRLLFEKELLWNFWLFSTFFPGIKKEKKAFPSSPLRKAMNLENIKEIQSLPIEDLNLSTRAYNGLKGAQINFVSDILAYSLKDLRKIKQLGQKSVQEIITTLETAYQIFLE